MSDSIDRAARDLFGADGFFSKATTESAQSAAAEPATATDRSARKRPRPSMRKSSFGQTSKKEYGVRGTLHFLKGEQRHAFVREIDGGRTFFLPPGVKEAMVHQGAVEDSVLECTIVPILPTPQGRPQRPKVIHASLVASP